MVTKNEHPMFHKVRLLKHSTLPSFMSSISNSKPFVFFFAPSDSDSRPLPSAATLQRKPSLYLPFLAPSSASERL